MTDPVIRVRGLRKAYGSVEAVRGVDLEIRAGQVFAFLGPNGAGKTTTVEILEGFRSRDGGDVEVLGVDPARAGAAWRSRLGVVLQSSQVPGLLTAREALELFAGYYPAPRPVDETLALVGLTEQAERRGARLSGGQQRRLDVALALIGDPELLFLDEPTTGFDPAARREAWDVIASLRDLGKTILLTTHYMDEAQRLADHVAIIDGGRIVGQGTPADLGGEARARTAIVFGLPQGVGPGELPGLSEAPTTGAGGRLELHTERPVQDLALLCGWAVERGVDLAGLEVARPSLEDVYLELTASEPQVEP
jgi:ABC-2 type transport system ATP-binding protein